ncbi:MAG: hypothetical protein P8126_03675 [Gammaproteobacteria bacterium]|jgi:ElaB/YqjD/DUF883 family membrane-anchored ribosome-binding protein
MAANNVQEELQILKDDVAKLRADITDLVGLLKDLGLQKVDETRGNVEEELKEQRARFQEALNRARERGMGSVEDLEQQMTEHPVGSLLTAFGIGYIIAKLSGGRS